ncbi:MAG: hypothetical protein WAN30_06805 [Acidimicrobiales bacterium]
MTTNSSWPVRIIKGFAKFWWDFLVGDTPELFVAALVVLGLVALCRVVWQLNTLALVALPVLCVGALAVSLRRAQRASREK